MTSNRFMHRSLAAAFTVVLVTAHVRPAWADCANDAQCKGDRICEKGVCVSPPPKAPAPPPVAPPPSAPPPTAPLPPPVQQPAYGQQPMQGGTRVLFEGTHEFVSAEGQNGTHGECHIPCSLTLPPGWYTVRAGSKTEQIDVGNRSTVVKVKNGCTTCYVFGGVNLGLSIPFFVGAGVLLDKSSTEEPGAALAVGGAIVAASGLALLIVGIAVGGGKIEQDDYAKNDRPASRVAVAPSGFSYAF